MLVSERIGQFFVESDGGRDRLEFTEYGAGDEWVVLLHGLLMPRRMQQPLARAMAAEGFNGYDKEWWHFRLPGDFAPLDIPLRCYR